MGFEEKAKLPRAVRKKILRLRVWCSGNSIASSFELRIKFSRDVNAPAVASKKRDGGWRMGDDGSVILGSEKSRFNKRIRDIVLALGFIVNFENIEENEYRGQLEMFRNYETSVIMQPRGKAALCGFLRNL
ncbi:hypothetical protein V1478_003586 [Vespula squamosa]|uniref:LAGLIDADG homing endonuclease n=1 Tax=Vespula squamosa TaxID=30214 RepID=A0ABD2BM85_VESSQ